MSSLLKFLDFLGLLDDSGKRLSITNCAVIIALAKMALTQTTPMDAGALFATVLNYAHRRHVASQDSDDSQRSDSQTPSNPAQ